LVCRLNVVLLFSFKINYNEISASVNIRITLVGSVASGFSLTFIIFSSSDIKVGSPLVKSIVIKPGPARRVDPEAEPVRVC
jgi:hypothetical protein